MDVAHTKRKQSVRLMIELFLKEREHQQLFLTAQQYPTPMNQLALDDAFRRFFTRIKTVQYISKLIKGYSVDFDKRVRNQPLTVSIDEKQTEDGYSTFIGMIRAGDVLGDLEQALDEEGSTTELFADKHISQAFSQLNSMQQTILIYSYFYGYQNKEIALFLDASEQRISYNKKRALERLKASVPKNNEVTIR
ncbi:sigma-70 family RNA polymerase sigma factor [Shouchella lehensis]|uniref:RNA polymerase sigma factor n=1 Tax=Shouchella lehensis G1 TaxID=1246626 RepID=A0A060M096_9BACI|nr:sigma-70 family RNA polymerase sigma factor [Shouchella lehensis]AIC95857.1 RNA polymerase sigma factor [Shouchella lehensis G1]